MNIRTILSVIVLLAFTTLAGAQQLVKVSSGSQNLADMLRAGKGDAAVALLEASPVLAKLPVVSYPGYLPIHLAAATGQVEVVSWLLQHGADPNANAGDDFNPMRPLQLAVMNGSTEIIDLLIKGGAKLDINEGPREIRYQSPLVIATAYGRLEIVRQLLDRGAPVENGRPTPLFMAAAGGYTDIFNLLLEHGADPSKVYNSIGTPLQAAACGGYIDMAKRLLDAGVSVESNNIQNITPLQCALSPDEVLPFKPYRRPFLNRFTTSYVSFMYKYVFNEMDTYCNRVQIPLMKASPATARVDRSATIKLLLDRGTRLTITSTSNDETLLYYAAAYGDVNIVRRCMKAGVSPNKCNKGGITPLAAAARYGQVDVIQLLLDSGVDVNTQGTPTNNEYPEGGAMGTALLYAADAGEVEAVDTLIARGADVNTADFLGRTPLFVAILHLTPLAKEEALVPDRRDRWISIAQKLLAKKADANCSAPPALTIDFPLQVPPTPMSLPDLVRKSRVPELIKMIAPGDPEPNSIDDNGMTLLASAVQENDLEKAKNLLLRGANADLRGKDRKSPIFYAKNLDMVKLLEENGANISARTNERETVLNYWCTDDAYIPMLKYVLEKHLVNPNDNGSFLKPLYLAVKAKNRIMIGILLDSGADAYAISIDRNVYTSPMSNVISSRDIDLVKFMLDHGVKVNAPYYSMPPLEVAVRKEAVDIIQLLLDKGADVNVVCGGQGSLMHIIVNDDLRNKQQVAVYKLILESPDDPKLGAKTSYSAERIAELIAEFRDKGFYDAPAVRNERRKTIRTMLIDRKINLNVFDGDLKSSLYIAVENDQGDIVAQLLDAGANPNYGSTQPLNRATSVVVAKILVEHGANMKLISFGVSLLCQAVRNNNIELARFFLEQGMSPVSKDVYDKLPIVYAKTWKNQPMIDLLIKYGATDEGIKQ